MKWFVTKHVGDVLTKYSTVIGNEDELRMVLRHRFKLSPNEIEDIIRGDALNAQLHKNNTIITVTRAYNE